MSWIAKPEGRKPSVQADNSCLIVFSYFTFIWTRYSVRCAWKPANCGNCVKSMAPARLRFAYQMWLAPRVIRQLLDLHVKGAIVLKFSTCRKTTLVYSDSDPPACRIYRDYPMQLCGGRQSNNVELHSQLFGFLYKAHFRIGLHKARLLATKTPGYKHLHLFLSSRRDCHQNFE